LFTKCARPATVWANSNVISPKVRCLLWLLILQVQVSYWW
jgi:hypothetical protein